MSFRYPQALITADDWGMSPGINDGILHLAKKGIVRRVSCMANGQFLDHRLEELKAIPDLSFGLHFDLTFGRSTKEKIQLVLRTLFNRKEIQSETRKEFQKQWNRLLSLGLTPSYVDGHHHIHLFFGVLEGLVEEAQKAGVTTIRTVCDPVLLFSTKLPLIPLSLLAKRVLKKAGLQTLPCWYPQLERIGVVRLRNGLASLTRPTEVIVHPACTNDLAALQIEDSYTDGRIAEFQILETLSSH